MVFDQPSIRPSEGAARGGNVSRRHNLYAGVSWGISRFAERFARTARVKRPRLVEKCRVGGRYERAIRRIIGHMEERGVCPGRHPGGLRA